MISGGPISVPGIVGEEPTSLDASLDLDLIVARAVMGDEL